MMSFTVLLHVGSASCCLFHAVRKLDMWKLHGTSLQHCWRHGYFRV